MRRSSASSAGESGAAPPDDRVTTLPSHTSFSASPETLSPAAEASLLSRSSSASRTRMEITLLRMASA